MPKFSIIIVTGFINLFYAMENFKEKIASKVSKYQQKKIQISSKSLNTGYIRYFNYSNFKKITLKDLSNLDRDIIEQILWEEEWKYKEIPLQWGNIQLISSKTIIGNFLGKVWEKVEKIGKYAYVLFMSLGFIMLIIFLVFSVIEAKTIKTMGKTMDNSKIANSD